MDDDLEKKLDAVSIFLTKQEAVQLRGYLNQLLDKPKLQHVHLSSEDFKKEITISIYTDENLSGFDERSKKLILHDE